mgnify:CR=1 FL=1
MNARAPRWYRHALFLAGRLHIRTRWDEGFLIGLFDLEGNGLLKPRS